MFFHRRQAPGDRRRNGRRPGQHAARHGRDDHPRGARRLVLGSDPQGRPGRRRQGQHRAALLQRSGGAEPGQPRADRDRQRRRGHRADAGQAGRDGAGGQGRAGQGYSGRRLQLGLRQLEGDGRAGVLRPGREAGRRRRRRTPAPRTARRRSSASSRSRARWRSNPAAPVSQQGFKGPDRDPERQQQGHAVGGVDDHRQAAAGQVHRPRRRAGRADRVGRGAVEEQRRQLRARWSPSTPTPRSSTRSRPAT